MLFYAQIPIYSQKFHFMHFIKFCFSLLFILFLGSCGDDMASSLESDLTATTRSAAVFSDVANQTIDGQDFTECFDFLYPIQVLQSDSIETTIADAQALEDFIAMNDKDDVDLVYPVTVVLTDNSEMVIENEDQLEQLLEECFGEGYDDEDDDEEEGESEDCELDELEDCYTLIYPIDIMLDGSVVTLTSDEDLEALEDMIEEDSEVEPVYPFFVKDADGNEIEVTDEEVFEQLEEQCEDEEDYEEDDDEDEDEDEEEDDDDDDDEDGEDG